MWMMVALTLLAAALRISAADPTPEVILNMAGVPLMMALGERFIGKGAWMLGLMWAVNPLQVEQATAWAVLSPLAFWLFLAATRRNRPTDWVIYTVAQIAALYASPLEPFFLLVSISYVLLFGRGRALARALYPTCLVIALASIPRMVELANVSSYEAGVIGLDDLVGRLLPSLLFGDTTLSLLSGSGILVVLIFGLAVGRHYMVRRIALGLWLFLPLACLLLVSTEFPVQEPIHFSALTAPLLLTLMWVAYLPGKNSRLPHLLTATLTISALVALWGV